MTQTLRLAAAIICLSAAALAQDTRGVILGAAKDPSGAVLAGAAVEARNLAANTTVNATTNAEGAYTIPYLIPGNYQITVEMPGFKKAVRGPIQLRSSERLTVDFSLEVGSTAESIEVKAEAPLLEQATASISMTIDAKRVSELPKVGGNPYYMARLSPGIASPGGRSAGNAFDYGSGVNGPTNGTVANSNEVTLDGSPNMFGRNLAFSLPEDLVQELRVETTGYDAAQGHTAGATVNVSMKAGTNAFHGTAYMFDSRLRATPWFTNRFIYDPRTGPINQEKIDRNTPSWLHRRWGGTASGPLVIPKLYNGKNKTFWSFGYEGLKIFRNLGITGTFPSEAQRRGDLSALLRAGAQYQIYDPATIAPAPGGRFSRQPLPGNIVPASRINPIAAKLVGFYPLPNQPGTADDRQNFFRTQDIDRNNTNYVGRLDQTFSDKHRMFVRVNYNERYEIIQDFPGEAYGNRPRQPGYGAVLDDVYTLSPSLLLNVRYGLTYQNPQTVRAHQGYNLASLGFPSALINEINSKNQTAGIAFPQIVVDGGAYTNLGDTGGNIFTNLYHTFQGTVTKLKGNHSLRAGADHRIMLENGYNYGNVAPRIEFNSIWTRGPLDSNNGAPIGQGFASFLLGVPTGGFVSLNASRAAMSKYTGFFLQDDWRINSRLTLNLGLRYEWESPLNERYNRSVTDYDFQTPNPIEPRARANYANNPIPELPAANFRTPGGLRFAGIGGVGRNLWNADRNNFAPRIGIAYKLFNRTVLRTGYGVFFDTVGVDREDPNQSGYSQSTNIIPSLDNGLTFQASLSNPLPGGLIVPPGSSQGLATFLGRGLNYFLPQTRNPYMQRWSMTIQQALPGRTVLEVGYVGNRGNRIGVTRDMSPVPGQYLSTSPLRDQDRINFLTAAVRNPFFGIPEFAGTGLGNQNTNRLALLQPLPHFGAVNTTDSIGYSWYHSFQAQLEKRFSKGFTIQGAYTWSKFMEATNFLNQQDLFLEEVISSSDFPHRLTAVGIYDLPIGKGRRFLTNSNRLVDGILGGWQIQGWYEAQVGAPIGFGNAIFTGNLKDIVIPKSQRTELRHFNVDAGFERNNARQLANNIRRFSSRFAGIRQPGYINLDASVFKNFKAAERVTVQFRMEAFNATNNVQFGDANTNPTNTAFGTIVGERGHGQRQVTFSLKGIW
jgi:hypothetical protein